MKVFREAKLIMTTLLVVMAVMVLVSPGAASAGTELVNPSFETRDLSGWSVDIPVGGSATAVTSYVSYVPPVPPYTSTSYVPQDGDYFALVKTNGGGFYTTVSQTFSASAGDKISGWAFFKAEDYMPFNDNTQVEIKSGGNVLATVFSANVSTVGGYGSTPWTYWEYTFAAPGTYTVEARIANWGDSTGDSHMGLDGVVLTVTILGPRDLKMGAIDELSMHAGESKHIDKAITEIQKSFDYVEESAKAPLYDSSESTCEGGAVDTSGPTFGSVVLSTNASGDLSIEVKLKGATSQATYDIWVNQYPGACPLSSPTAPGVLTTNVKGNGKAHVEVARVAGATNFWVSVVGGGQVLRSTAVVLPRYDAWTDDSHLDPKHGKKVFDHERHAVKELLHLLKCGGVTRIVLEYTGAVTVDVKVYLKDLLLDTVTVSTGGTFVVESTDATHWKLHPEIRLEVGGVEVAAFHTSCSRPIAIGDQDGEFVIVELDKLPPKDEPHITKEALASVEMAIDQLVKADRLLAETQLEEVRLLTPHPAWQDKFDSEIAKAEEELAKGDADRDAGKFDKAIGHYKKAWEHANHAEEAAAEAPLYDSSDSTCEGGAADTSGQTFGSVVLKTNASGDLIVEVKLKGATPQATYDIWVNQYPGACPLSSPTAPGVLTTNVKGDGKAHVEVARVAGATNFWVSAVGGGQVLRSTAVVLN